MPIAGEVPQNATDTWFWNFTQISISIKEENLEERAVPGPCSEWWPAASIGSSQLCLIKSSHLTGLKEQTTFL